jgi:hypothetical protein
VATCRPVPLHGIADLNRDGGRREKEAAIADRDIEGSGIGEAGVEGQKDRDTQCCGKTASC